MPKRRQVSYKSLKDQFLPPLGPEDAASFGGQMQSLMGQFLSQRNLLKLQAGDLRAAFKGDKADIARNRRMALSASAGAMNSRGILGSSVDVEGQSNIRADAASQTADARTAYQSGLYQNVAQLMQAQRNLQIDSANALMARDAARSGSAVEDLLNNLVRGGPGWKRNLKNKGSDKGRNTKPSGGGRNTKPSGPGPLMGFPLGNLSNRELTRLQTRITNRMQKKTRKLEASGLEVFHKDGKVFFLSDNPQALPSVHKRLTKLHRRRKRVKRNIGSEHPTGRSGR